MADSLYSLINLLLPRNLTPFMADSHEVFVLNSCSKLGEETLVWNKSRDWIENFQPGIMELELSDLDSYPI